MTKLIMIRADDDICFHPVRLIVINNNGISNRFIIPEKKLHLLVIYIDLNHINVPINGL